MRMKITEISIFHSLLLLICSCGITLGSYAEKVFDSNVSALYLDLETYCDMVQNNAEESRKQQAFIKIISSIDVLLIREESMKGDKRLRNYLTDIKEISKEIEKLDKEKKTNLVKKKRAEYRKLFEEIGKIEKWRMDS